LSDIVLSSQHDLAKSIGQMVARVNQAEMLWFDHPAPAAIQRDHQKS